MKTQLLIIFTVISNIAIHGQYEIDKTDSINLTNNQIIEFKMLPVDENTKYTLVFNGQLDGKECIEENPRMQITLQNRRKPNDKMYDFLPKMEIQFFDAANRFIGVKNQCALPFRATHTYETTFYPPHKGKFMKLIIQAGSNTSNLKISDMHLKQTEDQGAININPIINETGLYNYSGWETFAPGASLIKKENGTIGFNSGYGSNSAKFPLKPDTEYIASALGTSFGYASTVVLRVLDENDKKIQEVKIYKRIPGITFTTATNCVRGVIHVRSVILDEVKVNTTKIQMD